MSCFGVILLKYIFKQLHVTVGFKSCLEVRMIRWNDTCSLYENAPHLHQTRLEL